MLAAAAAFAYVNRIRLRETVEKLREPELPQEVAFDEIAQTSDKKQASSLEAKYSFEAANPISALEPSSPVSKSLLPVTLSLFHPMNLAVPFTSQAPHMNWDWPYGEACEEASAIMVDAYYKKYSFTPESADEAIKKLVAWQEKTFGYFEDTNAEEVARMLREYFGYARVELDTDISMENIARHLQAGRPIILPAAGRLLPNPNFKVPGPLYHMLVIKGITKDGLIITNDPGTRKGYNFTYKLSDLFNAAHDWNRGDVYKGRKVMVVVYN